MPDDQPIQSTGTKPSSTSPLSLSRLREAFAAMLGAPREEQANSARSRVSPNFEPTPAEDDSGGGLGSTALQDPCEISPRSVVEAMLFVGRPDNGTLSAREMAAAMRGCSPAEVHAAVAELNKTYRHDAAPYEILGGSNGYRLALRDEFARVRDKFYGRMREAKLSTAALEVLSIVAYKQPVTRAEINRLRGSPSGAALATLVRLKLVRLERPADDRQQTMCYTTERFLRLFGLENLAALPKSEELENE